MTIDRDGIRRDAEATILAKPHLAAVARAHDCLALLNELEQAEATKHANAWSAAAAHNVLTRLRSTLTDTEAALHKFQTAYCDAEARLAKVPALVEIAEYDEHE